MDTATALTDPEVQFVGGVLWLPCSAARRVLAGMSADDLADPNAAHVLQLAIETVADGRDPSPVHLYAHAIATGRAVGEHARHRLSRWLADAYGATGHPPARVDHLKGVVLETAWRRRAAEHARRVFQAADDAPTDVLAHLIDDTAHLDALKSRADAAMTTGAQHPRHVPNREAA